MDKTKLGFQTKAAHLYVDGKKENQPLTIPIYQTTNFQAASSEELGRLFKTQSTRFYTRFGHPTLATAGEKVAQLEKAEAGLVFSSGMGAITTALLTVLRAGDHVVAQRNIFAQTFLFLDGMARELGIETTFVDAADPKEVEKALRPNTRLVYIETPSNPQIIIVDIAAIASITRRAGSLLFADNTFASPFVQNPIELGADLVRHSGTKYLGGHSDVLCGAVAGGSELVKRIRDAQVLLGNLLDAHAAWLLLRGIRTLGLRMQRQSETAQLLAEFLETQEGVKQVYYPGLKSSPYYEVARKQMRTGGGMLSFEVEGGLTGARAFLDTLDLVLIASSLGGVETTIEIPYELDFSEDELGDAAADSGIGPGLIRLSVGTEEAEDLFEDFQKGLAALKTVLAKRITAR